MDDFEPIAFTPHSSNTTRTLDGTIQLVYLMSVGSMLTSARNYARKGSLGYMTFIMSKQRKIYRLHQKQESLCGSVGMSVGR